MSKYQSNSILSSEEVQRIIDERLSVIISKEAMSMKDTASSVSDKKNDSIFRHRRHND